MCHNQVGATWSILPGYYDLVTQYYVFVIPMWNDVCLCRLPVSPDDDFHWLANIVSQLKTSTGVPY